MTERLDNLILVDVFDNPIGTADKRRAHTVPLLHRAFSVFLINDRGELLLQKRASGKYHSGGLWASLLLASKGGGGKHSLRRSPPDGRTGRYMPLREIGCFVYLHRFHDALYEYEYDHVLIGRHCGPFTPNPEEIEELRWVTPAQLTEELRTTPERFASWFLTAAPMVLRFLE